MADQAAGHAAITLPHTRPRNTCVVLLHSLYIDAGRVVPHPCASREWGINKGSSKRPPSGHPRNIPTPFCERDGAPAKFSAPTHPAVGSPAPRTVFRNL